MKINLKFYLKYMEKLIAARYYTLSQVRVNIFENVPLFVMNMTTSHTTYLLKISNSL